MEAVGSGIGENIAGTFDWVFCRRLQSKGVPAKASHLTLDEREVIAQMQRAGKMQTQIADRLGRSKSTISRELQRNCSRNGYWAVAAQRKSERRRSERPWGLELEVAICDLKFAVAFCDRIGSDSEVVTICDHIDWAGAPPALPAVRL